jgi:deazaflavin-dependent oxidoreductase (nitroreductase family)
LPQRWASRGTFAGAPLLLLHTVGARSGQQRINPMMYLADGDNYLVFASKAGWDSNPDWYRRRRSGTPGLIALRHLRRHRCHRRHERSLRPQRADRHTTRHGLLPHRRQPRP